MFFHKRLDYQTDFFKSFVSAFCCIFDFDDFILANYTIVLITFHMIVFIDSLIHLFLFI